MKFCRLYFVLIFFLFIGNIDVSGQKPEPPVPVEFMLGHKEVYSQVVFKKYFNSTRRFDFFGLATYTANYENDVRRNRSIIISQIGYNFKNGFGVMTGVDFNSFAGFYPILGPKHSFASKNFLAVTNLSFFMNDGLDTKVFGLYEYHPSISPSLKFYSRLQFIHNFSLNYKEHNISYVYLRAGIQRKSLIVGFGVNFNWAGPNKIYDSNMGPFIRWEFN